MNLTTIALTAGIIAGLTACGENVAQPTPGGQLRPVGTFTLTYDAASNVATIKAAVYGEITYGADGNPNTNPPGTIQAITQTALLPGQGGCPAGTNCFTVQLTNFTGVFQSGVYMGIDAITPATGRALIAPTPPPAGVTAPLGGRMFGDMAPLASSPTLPMNFTIPDLSSYTVTGRFWGDDGAVIGNLALGQPSALSSTGCFGGNPGFGNDGIVNGAFGSGNVFHSCNAVNEWWDVDLGASRVINQVQVFNRTDCCETRLRDWFVQVSTAPFPTGFPDPATTAGLATTTFSNQQPGASGAAQTDIAVNSAVGRYVRITNGSDNGDNWLHLTEIRVNGF